ncbi:hypothetical protein B2J88_42405, partial [Rhodococcus sp. SRB_17]|nr:hypothetical protein [Rhodococcus sp. SRB_17]
MAAIAPLLLVGCWSDSPAAEPSVSGAESTSVDANTGSGGCDAAARYGNEESLFGREWLLDHKRDPSTSVVTLRRCHFVHNQDIDIDRSAPDSNFKALTGDLVPPPALVTDGGEVQRILLSLPDSTDPSRHCPGGGEVDSFDEYTVIDQYGVSVAKFQTSEYGSCGVRNVI